jgi:pyrimidine-nucleoside phosphorylase
MRAVDIIMKKRGTFIRTTEGKQVLTGSTALTNEEIRFIINGYVAGTIPDYQIASWLMAVYFNGMSFEETGVLTDCMLHSGSVIELHGYEKDNLHGPFIDKHSTGGVGDKISLILAPVVAACGIQIPMMSGRALGHTGGTLDKLESIDGYKVSLDPVTFRTLIAKTGYAMTGQTKEIVPADRLLYALRDVTGTVESVPLITASILSKKVAEGADGLVFDVKYGSGAFMKSIPDSEMLASFLVKTAGAMGKKAAAVLTDMNTPLGWKVGNFLEIEESLECLQGHGPDDVIEETYVLGAEMLILGGRAQSEKDGREQCRKALESGKALELFLENIRDQGGNPGTLLSQQGKRRSPFHLTMTAKQDGYITLDAYQTGLAGVDLGVGRSKTTDSVCPDAGMILHAKTGSKVTKGEPIIEVYGRDTQCLIPAVSRLENAVTYSDKKPEKQPLILRTIRQ